MKTTNEKHILEEDKSYGVFCIASQLEQHSRECRELDFLWSTATELYNEFINSKFNNSEKSELDCINEFLNSKL